MASRWLGLRAYLEVDRAFAALPPAAVALWDRHLAYGAALGVTRVAGAALTAKALIPARADYLAVDDDELTARPWSRRVIGLAVVQSRPALAPPVPPLSAMLSAMLQATAVRRPADAGGRPAEPPAGRSRRGAG